MGYYDFKETKCSTCQYYCGKRRLKEPFLGGSGIVCDEGSGLCCCRHSKNNAKTVSEKDWCWKYEQWTVISREIAKKEYTKVKEDHREYEYKRKQETNHANNPFHSMTSYLTSNYHNKEKEFKDAQVELRSWKLRPLMYAILLLPIPAFIFFFCLIRSIKYGSISFNLFGWLIAVAGLATGITLVVFSLISKKRKNKIAELTPKVAICKEEMEQAKARIEKYEEILIKREEELLKESLKERQEWHNEIDQTLDEMIKNEANNVE